MEIILIGFGSVVTALVLVLGGIFTVARADYYLATREIAINTRKTDVEKPAYSGLNLAATLSRIFGFIFIAAGVLVLVGGVLFSLNLAR